MATPERRAVLDDVLGPVQRPEEGDALWTRTGGILQELLGTSLTGMAERFRTLSPTAGGSCEARHAAWFAFLDLVRMDCGSTREAWFVSKKKGVDITNATSPFA